MHFKSFQFKQIDGATVSERKSLLKNFPEKNGPNYLRMEQERRADVREAGDGQRF